MTEEGAETPQERSIRLVNADDKLHFYLPEEKAFSSKTHFIPSLGEIVLNGELHEPDDVPSLALVGNELIEEQDRQSYARGLVELGVAIRGSSAENLLCSMKLPDGSTLKSKMRSSIDTVERDILKKGATDTDDWQKEGSDLRYRVFVPSDPKVLSQLEFYFNTIPE